MLVKTRADRIFKEPIFYQAHFDTETLIYDYNSDLPMSEPKADEFPRPQPQVETSVPAPLPPPGESIDTPLAPKGTCPPVIMVEVG
jgi:hypothetical protein